MGEKEFEREVLGRLIKVETLLQMVASTCPGCQARIQALEIGAAKIDESAKSSHKRINGIYKTAGAISTAIGLLINGMAFLISQAAKVKGGQYDNAEVGEWISKSY